MSIKLQCPCGQVYRVKDEHVGKVVQCRKCGQELKVPRVANPSVSQELKPATEIVDEPCPSCGQPLPLDKAVCPNCRYSRHLKRCLKKKIERRTQPVASNRQESSGRKKLPRVKPRESIFTDHSFDWSAIGWGIAMMVGGGVAFAGLLLVGFQSRYLLILCLLGFANVVRGVIGYS